MTQTIRISHPEVLTFTHWTAKGETNENGGHILSWHNKAEKITEPGTLTVCTGSFDSVRAFNSIELNMHPEMKHLFPSVFRIEISSDGKSWETIIRETDFKASHISKGLWNFPVISARHIKLVILLNEKNPMGFYEAAFGPFRVMISGITNLEASSELDRLWVKENIIDQRPDYGWSSSLRLKRHEEYLMMDLGAVNRVCELRLLSKDDPDTFFPENFRVSYSEDKITWHHLLDETGFTAEPGTWYKWRFIPHNLRFLRISIDESPRTREGKYLSQIIEAELYAYADSLEDSSDRVQPVHIPHASVLRSGLVRLAVDGENREGVVVQAHDRRLRDATTDSKGIVELAADGEESAGLAVQANDRRLKIATEDLPGIVRLARDGEVRAGHAVQSNDSRLRPASESEAGLVELAADGENRPGVAVQGNDSRLRYAGISAPGIVKLAEDGSDKPNEVIQGNDSRLKAATTESKGIMQFAKAGEEAGEKAVQGNDPRLRKATTEQYGIVKIARNGEKTEGKVVSADDSRLNPATEESFGTVMLARHGSDTADKVVRSDDPRLSDSRRPLPHTHDYAPSEHSFESHSGTIRIQADMGESYKSVSPVPFNHAPVIGVNTGKGSGVAGNGEREGVTGTARETGVIGYSTEAGTGVLGAARTGAGGQFISFNGFSVVAGGKNVQRGLESADYGLLSYGVNYLTKTTCLAPESTGHASAMAMYFRVNTDEVIVPGDLLVATEKEGLLKKSTEAAQERIIGVAVEKAALLLNTPEDFLKSEIVPEGRQGVLHPKGMELVALSGVVMVRATAAGGPIRPGDLLIASSEAGMARRLQNESVKPGAVFAKSLGILEEGEGKVRVLLIHTV